MSARNESRATALTRAGKGDVVTFRTKDGRTVNGVALKFLSDRMVVGVQDADKPTVLVHGQRADGTSYAKRVPNNSYWVVPYDSVCATSLQTAV